MDFDFYHLSEQQRRRADWRPGEPLDFGRYGVWHMPRVEVVTGTLVSHAGSFCHPEYLINGHPAPAYSDLVEAMVEGCDSFKAGMAVVHFVLGHNYDLDADEFASLVIHGIASMPRAGRAATLARMPEVAYSGPVNAAARLIKSYPRFNPEGTGVLIHN
ncbi:hypothetical protein [Singulisphaera sp. PoT]|uniref:hypothetical protein n=1 Tax=Singulisphaera sp. PoT TaxID=3411797 RepID=UPI003BF465D3